MQSLSFDICEETPPLKRQCRVTLSIAEKGRVWYTTYMNAKWVQDSVSKEKTLWFFHFTPRSTRWVSHLIWILPIGAEINIDLYNRRVKKARQKNPPKHPSCTQRGQLSYPMIQTTITRQRGQACYVTIWKKRTSLWIKEGARKTAFFPPMLMGLCDVSLSFCINVESFL